ncbi:hypothetical protein VdG2_02378 [Verticillium dahliae VDG2]|nr:hypothetical protein VdG2_02378 [Verticillium dahliae VDG2]
MDTALDSQPQPGSLQPGSVSTPSSFLDEFLKLKRPDGQPDTAARSEAVESLIDALSPWERWHLRTRMNALSIGLARLPDLPAEVIAMIGSHLRLSDIASCRAVSQAWSRAWTQDEVARDLLRHFYPGLLETASAAAPRRPALRVFDEASRRSRRRQAFRFTACLAEDTVELSEPDMAERPPALSPDPALHPGGEFPVMHPGAHGMVFYNISERQREQPNQYCHGRFLWQLDDCCFYLDNFDTGYRRLISWTEGRLRGIATCNIALTSHLVVLTNERRNLLVVYNMALQEFRTVSLPSRLDRCYADRTSIGLALHSVSEMYLWRWDEGLQALEVAPPHRASSEPYGETCFMFHPTKPKVFSIVTLCRTGGNRSGSRRKAESVYSLHLHVSDYHDRQLLTTRTHERTNLPSRSNPLGHPQQRRPRGSVRDEIRWSSQKAFHPINTHGTHAAFVDSPSSKDVALVSYNMVTRQMHLDLLGDQPAALFKKWRDLGGQNGIGLFVFMLWEENLYVHLCHNKSGTAAFGFEPFLRHVDIRSEEWNGKLKLAVPSRGMASSITSYLYGDDRYLLLSREIAHYYVVWKFDNLDEPGKAPKGWNTWSEIQQRLPDHRAAWALEHRETDEESQTSSMEYDT